MYREETGLNHVGFWARVVEYLIDGLCIAAIEGIFWFVFHSQGAGTLFGVAASIVDFIVLQKIYGQTVGKMAMGHYLVRADGRPLSWGIVIGRYFALMLSSFILEIGFMMVGWTRFKQGLHDIICNTYVIRKR